ncbi:MAG: CapA family protein [Bacteroidales bacterium]
MTAKRVIIAGVGDIMPGTSYPSPKYLPPNNNPYPLIENVADILREPDITFGNLEGSFLNEGVPLKKCRDTTNCYIFRIPEKYAGILSYAGFDLISIANNHFMDFGSQAAIRTIQLLDSLGIKYAGTEEVPYTIITRDSITVGFSAFSVNKGTLNLNDYETAEKIVRKLDSECNIVIVSFHGGAEGAENQRVIRNREYFHGEDRGNVYEFAHKMIDAGADVVFGHGPHVTRAIELYKDRLICYSLGNFCTYRRINVAGPNGVAPVVRVETDITGRFISGDIIPVCHDAERIVRYDPLKRAIFKIRELTLLDFPDTGPEITDDGKIIKR